MAIIFTILVIIITPSITMLRLIIVHRKSNMPNHKLEQFVETFPRSIRYIFLLLSGLPTERERTFAHIGDRSLGFQIFLDSLGALLMGVATLDFEEG